MIIKSAGLPGLLPYLSAGKFKGSILILTLWSICTLSVLAVALSYQVRQKIMLVKRLDERSSLRLISDAGLKTAIAEFKKENLKNYDALQDNWSNNAYVFKGINFGVGICDVCYNIYDEQAKIAKLRYGLIDEERKININKADLATLERLFKVALDFDEMDAQELAASIVDWRDSDSELSIPLGSAEDSDYRNLRYPYEAKDASFETLEEVKLVKGVNSQIFEKVKGYITIYGSGKVNINTASRHVLLALGLSESIVNRIISFRSGEDGIAGTADDKVFDEPGGIVAKFSQYVRLSDSELAGLSAVSERFLSTTSENFMARCVAKKHGSKNPSEFVYVISRLGRVLSCREF